MEGAVMSCFTVDRDFPYYCGGCIAGQGCLYKERVLLGEIVQVLAGTVIKKKDEVSDGLGEARKENGS
jgi:hypothetical protein